MTVNHDPEQYELEPIQESEYSAPVHWGDSSHLVEEDRYRRMTEYLCQLVSSAADPNGIAVCDIGCGDGRTTVLMYEWLTAHRIPHIVVGVDYSAQAIAWARRKAAEHGHKAVVFGVGNGTEAVRLFATKRARGMPALFLLREVIEHMPDDVIDATLQAIRANDPAAAVLVTTPSTNSPVDKKHLRHYTPQALDATMTRNGYPAPRLTGFGFRPKAWYRTLTVAKSLLNRTPVLWRAMSVCWRRVNPSRAITLIAYAPGAQPAGDNFRSDSHVH